MSLGVVSHSANETWEDEGRFWPSRCLLDGPFLWEGVQSADEGEEHLAPLENQRGTALSRMLSAVEMVVRHDLGQKGSQVGFWSRLGIISCWDCGSKWGPDWAKLQTSWNSSWVPSMGPGRLVPLPEGGPYQRILIISVSLSVHIPQEYLYCIPSALGKRIDHIWLSVLLTIVTSHHPRLFDSAGPSESGFLTIPTSQRRKLWLPKVKWPAQGHTIGKRQIWG